MIIKLSPAWFLVALLPVFLVGCGEEPVATTPQTTEKSESAAAQGKKQQGGVADLSVDR
jgi:hypothetical protein